MSDPTGRLRWPRILAVAVVLALLAGVPAVLWWTGDRQVAQVAASVDVPQCEGTEPTTARGPDGTFTAVAIPLSEGFTCTLTVRLLNRGDREVTLGRVRVPVAGPEAGAAFEVTHVGGNEVDGDGAAAVTVLDRPLAGGDEDVVDVQVAFRPSGCTTRGATQVAATIEVSDLLASRDLVVEDLPYFLGTADSSCDS